MNEWIFSIPSIVFTRIKDGFSASVKSKYKMTDKNFSSVSNANKYAVFPFVYIKLIDGEEQGQTLDGETLNGALFTFQADVTDNQSQTRSQTVMKEVLENAKKIGFDVVSIPIFDNTDTTYRMTARFRRVIGASDEI